jgi:hypothetical protein
MPALSPFLGGVLPFSQENFRAGLERSGAAFHPVSFGHLESLNDGHPFFGVLRDVRALSGGTPASPALWRVEFGGSQPHSSEREACSLWALLECRGYYPPVLREMAADGILEHPLVPIAVATVMRPMEFRLLPQSRMPSLAGLSRLLMQDAWPLYTGMEEVRIHGYRSTAYGATLHDLRHFLTWKEWSVEDRRDACRLYEALRVALVRPPSLSSLAGRIGAKLFYGDGLFDREATVLDECLSGPAATGNRIFPQMILRGVDGAWEGDRTPLYQAVERAFSGHPRRNEWLAAVAALKAERRVA